MHFKRWKLAAGLLAISKVSCDRVVVLGDLNSNVQKGPATADVGAAPGNDGGGESVAGDSRAVSAGAGNGGIGGSTTLGDASAGFAGGGVRPSCVGLASTCGPNGISDCCSSSLVPGGTFYRGYDGGAFNDKTNPAQVASFRLDTYEISIGRFRSFAAAYSQTMIREGAGRNPNNPNDAGWSSAWNASMEVDAASLVAAVEVSPFGAPCDYGRSSASDNLPVACITWFEAEAFCIWDGGRLPTEAEWSYAAAGGAEQRQYPWGSATPDCSYANGFFRTLIAVHMTEPCFSSDGLAWYARVGLDSPRGDGKFGQSDLGGNVAEWVQDYRQEDTSYPNPCDNCANLTISPSSPSPDRVNLGGYIADAEQMQSSERRANPPSAREEIGARCARNPL